MQCTDVACHYSLMMLHVAWSMCVSVCVLGTRVSCAKTAEAIELPFGGGAVSCGFKEPCIRWGPDAPREGHFVGCMPAHRNVPMNECIVCLPAWATVLPSTCGG